MKRLVLALTLSSFAFGSVRPAAAGDWNYAGNYPPAHHNNDVLKKVLIGGALIGAGYLLGRLTAPQNSASYGYYGNGGSGCLSRPQMPPQLPMQPQFQPSFGYQGFYAPQTQHVPHCNVRF